MRNLSDILYDYILCQNTWDGSPKSYMDSKEAEARLLDDIPVLVERIKYLQGKIDTTIASIDDSIKLLREYGVEDDC